MNWKSKAIIVTVAILAIVSGLTSLGVVLARDSQPTNPDSPLFSNQEESQALQAGGATQVIGELVTESFTGQVTVAGYPTTPLSYSYPDLRHVSIAIGYDGLDTSGDFISVANHIGSQGLGEVALNSSNSSSGISGFAAADFDTLSWSLWVTDWEKSQPVTVYWRVTVTYVQYPNQAPNQPSNVSPANGATGVSVTPTLQSSSFSDPDAGDTHAASQWKIRTASSTPTVVFDSGTDTSNLTSITAPSATLSNSTTYYWHVRHQDNNGNWSEWSTETSFTTAASADNTAPKTPSRISPAYGATVGSTPTFDWSDVTDPSGVTYQLQIDNNSDYSSPLLTKVGLTSSTYTLTAGEALTPGVYYWRVRAVDGAGNASAWNGGYWKFTVA